MKGVAVPVRRRSSREAWRRVTQRLLAIQQDSRLSQLPDPRSASLSENIRCEPRSRMPAASFAELIRFAQPRSPRINVPLL